MFITCNLDTLPHAYETSGTSICENRDMRDMFISLISGLDLPVYLFKRTMIFHTWLDSKRTLIPRRMSEIAQ